MSASDLETVPEEGLVVHGPRRRVRTHYYFTNQKSPIYFCGKSKLANPVRPGDPSYVDLPEVVCPTCEVVYLNLMMGQ